MKLPWFKFYAGDWLSDPALGQCEEATRGIWIDVLSVMHLNDQSGILSGTFCQLAKILRTTPDNLQKAVEDLKATGSTNVTLWSRESHAGVTLINRRMRREWIAREHCRKRKSRSRVTPPVTPLSRPNHAVDVRSQKSEVRSQIYITPPRFAPPSLEMVKLQCAKIGLPESEAESFVAHYESNGWKVGKNPMRSWTAAMINWRKNFQSNLFAYGTGNPRRTERANPRNAGTIAPVTDYGAAARRKQDQQRGALDGQVAEDATLPPATPNPGP